MRRGHQGRVDTNHREIIDALRAVPGCTVTSTAAVGNGFVDCAVGYRGHNYLLEIKPPGGVRGGLSRQTLTDDEEKWHRTWRGQRAIVCSVEQALYVIGATRQNVTTGATLTQEARS